MSEARKCDRCHGFYELSKEDQSRKDWPADTKGAVARLFLRSSTDDRGEWYDLCPNCVESLKEWLEHPKLVDEEIKPLHNDSLDSLIEENRAFIQKIFDEWGWVYGPPTKRKEMWAEIFAIHKKTDIILKVKKEDVNAFLHELEKRIPEITWASGIKIFEAKGTIKDIYDGLKTCDTFYFRIWKENKLSYSSDQHIYQYKDLKHIVYLPPMRWDLFKKGRIYVKLDAEHFDEFKQACIRELGISPNTGYFNGEMIVINIPKEERFVITRDLKGFKARKIINWDDVRL